MVANPKNKVHDVTVYRETHTHNSYPQVLKRRELPLEVPVKSSYVNSSGDVDALCEVIDVFEGTLNTIKDGAHDSRPQLHREWLSSAEHGVSNTNSSCG